MIADSGQAFTHNPQPSHASAFINNACCQLCAKPLTLPIRLMPARARFGKVPTAKTDTGHTRTQSPLPSQRLRSITGRMAPGLDLHTAAADTATLDVIMKTLQLTGGHFAQIINDRRSVVKSHAEK